MAETDHQVRAIYVSELVRHQQQVQHETGARCELRDLGAREEVPVAGPLRGQRHHEVTGAFAADGLYLGGVVDERQRLLQLVDRKAELTPCLRLLAASASVSRRRSGPGMFARTWDHSAA